MSAIEQEPAELQWPEVLQQLKIRRAALLAQISDLDPLISGFEKLIEHSTVAPSSRPTRVLAPVRAISSEPAAKTTPVPKPGPYSHMEFPAAAHAYLVSVGVPKTSAEVADGVKAGGFKTKAANFAASAHAMLGRPSAAVLGIVRTADRKWEVKS